MNFGYMPIFVDSFFRLPVTNWYQAAGFGSKR